MEIVYRSSLIFFQDSANLLFLFFFPFQNLDGSSINVTTLVAHISSKLYLFLVAREDLYFRNSNESNPILLHTIVTTEDTKVKMLHEN